MEHHDLILEQILRLIQPVRVILFGSSAVDPTRAKDIDLLVVMPNGINRRATSQMLQRNLRRYGKPVDIVVVTEADLIEHRDDFWTVIGPAVEKGRVIYAA